MLLNACLLLFCLQDPAPAPPAGWDLDALLSQLPGREAAQILDFADATAVPEDGAWREQAAARLATADAPAALFLGRLLAQAEHSSGGEALVALIDNADPGLARAALATLALPAFQQDEALLTALGNWLTEHAVEADPPRYCEAAYTLHVQGDGARRRAAQRLLQGALHSTEPSARSHAALALARAGWMEDDEVLRELETLAQGISAEAVLAGALLHQYEQQMRLRAKIQALNDYLEGREVQPDGKDAGDFAILEEVMKQIEARHMEGDRFTREQLIAAAADGMLRRLDPYSNYMSSQEFTDFVFDMNPEYGGIGAYVNVVNGVFTITRPIYSGPAYEVGLLSGDAILEVDGWSTHEQPEDETIKRLKGKPGTPVVVKVMRPGWDEPRDYTVTRRVIHLPTLQTEPLPGGILYLELVNFTDQCGREIEAAIRGAQAQGPLTGVVLDLRDNPGGYLSEAVQVCDVFLPPGKLIVSTRSRAERSERYYTQEPAAVSPDLPLMVLVNHYSASASEIVAGALSIHGRATVIGERTHGKGSVQNLISMKTVRDERWTDENGNGRWDAWEDFYDHNDNGKYDLGPRIKLTLAYYYLPDGSTIHTIRDTDGRVVEEGGVAPDIEVSFPDLDIASLRDLDRLIRAKSFENFAKDLFQKDAALAVELAEFDGRDATRYPGFDEFYQGLNTVLDRNEVRRWVRRSLRNVVSDARGKTFPGWGFLGDFQEDPQLSTAIKQILQQAGLTVGGVPEYAAVF